jgi:hypothetical protein
MSERGMSKSDTMIMVDQFFAATMRSTFASELNTLNGEALSLSMATNGQRQPVGPLANGAQHQSNC